MMPVAKHFDPVLGIDLHIILTPAGIPVIIPHPFIGFVLDLFDYLPLIGSTVKINNRHKAIAGTNIQAFPPHFPIGGTFIKPVANQAEMFFGSQIVQCDGDAMSHAVHLVLSCHSIGMITPIRPKKKNKLKSFVLPTSIVLPIPTGPPVLIGGPPTISLMAMGMKAGFMALGALGKGLKKLSKKSKTLKRLKKKLKKRRPSHNKSCGQPGEPVDVVTGANVDSFIDYNLDGPIPFKWIRYYNSLMNYKGSLGHNFKHEYDRQLYKTNDGFEYINQEGEVVEFSNFDYGTNETINDGLLLKGMGNHIYEIEEYNQPTMMFHLNDRVAPNHIKTLKTDSYQMTFLYDNNQRLSVIIDSLSNSIFFQYKDNLIEKLLLQKHNSEEKHTIAKYNYWPCESLREWKDANNKKASYFYDSHHRMIKKTDRNDYSFHYLYDESGRCEHTYGDEGLYDVKFTYYNLARYTEVEYSDEGKWLFIYDVDGVITEIVDPYGGATCFQVDENGKVTHEIDPGGSITTLVYNEWDGLIGRVDALGYFSLPLHIEPHPPDQLSYKLPETPLEWEWGYSNDPFYEQTLEDAHPFFYFFSKEEVKTIKELCQNYILKKENVGFEYDSMNRKIKEIEYHKTDQKKIELQEWVYDRNGNIKLHKDKDGAIKTYDYCKWNLIKNEMDHYKNTIAYEYSPREKITQIKDPNKTISKFIYDKKDRLIEVYRHGRLKEKYKYDIADNLIEKKDSNNKILLSFDVGNHNLHSIRKLSSGENHYFEYNERGLITRAATDDFNVYFEYNSKQQMILDQRDGVGVVHEYSDPQLKKTEILSKYNTIYEQNENSLQIYDPTGKAHIFQYSEDGLLTRILSNKTKEFCQYDKFGRCLNKIQFNTKKALTYSRQYIYSAEGDLKKIIENGTNETVYNYDKSHRLISEVLPDNSICEYKCDAAGNLIQQPGLNNVVIKNEGNGNQLQYANGDEFFYNNRNHINKRIGPLDETSFYYNSCDMLVKCVNKNGKWTATYDPLGRRVKKQWNDNIVEYFWDDFRLAAEVYNNNKVRVYIYCNEKSLVPFMFVEYNNIQDSVESGCQYFLFTNQIGTPLQAEDSNGDIVWKAKISPYGNANVQHGNKINVSLRFPGHYYDEEINLCYNRFRYYSPELGRYIQSDPIGIVGGINLYSYHTNPLTNVDIDGLQHPDSVELNDINNGNNRLGHNSENILGIVNKTSRNINELFRATNELIRNLFDSVDFTGRVRGKHHLFPKALGNNLPYGHKSLILLGRTKHTVLQGMLDRHLRTITKRLQNGTVVDMFPRRGNSGRHIIRNFTLDERINAIDTFYRNFLNGRFYPAFQMELNAAIKGGHLI